MSRFFSFSIGFMACVTLAGFVNGQAYQRKATFVPGGRPGGGKCTIEVVVDGAADVEIRGNMGTLRNLSGQPPQWRRFECTGPLPPDAPNFRFSGVDGRGRQELVRDPRNGGVAVVRIQDSQGGSEGYTFDLTWDGGGGDGGAIYQQPNSPPVRRRYTTEEAVRVCQDAVRHQAEERFHTRNVSFRKTALDDNPGRQDWVVGILDVRRGYEQDESLRFSCSVNFDTGEVRSAQMDPMPGGWRPGGDVASSNVQAIEGCERAVEERIRRDGYQHVDFVSIKIDDRPGRNDSIIGNARADRRDRSDSYEFSCDVNLRSGEVRSVNVRRR
jgi:hypothetical protein